MVVRLRCSTALPSNLPGAASYQDIIRRLDILFQLQPTVSMLNLSSKQLRRAANIQDKIASLQKELSRIVKSPAHGKTSAAPKRKRKMSAAGRAKIAAAARARWARVKGAKKPAKAASKPRRKMSAAGRAKIAAAARARWKKAKAAGKNSL